MIPDAPRRGGPRRLLLNLALLAVSTTLALALVEIGARLLKRHQKGGKERDERRFYTEYDPWLGWKHKPGARVAIERRDYQSEVSINSLGLCDKERRYQKPRGGFRILLLGDSFIEAFSVPAGKGIAALLETSLSQGRNGFEVINGGVVGYSTDQEYLFFTREAFRFEPDVVLLFVYYNDILANGSTVSYRKAKPKLSFTTGYPRVAGVPVPEIPAEAADPRPPEPQEGSVALAMIGDRLERSAPRAYSLLAQVGVWPPIRVITVPGELKVYQRSWSQEIDLAFRITGKILNALALDVWGRGGRFAVVYVPSSLEVHDADWELTLRRYGLDKADWDRGRVVSALGEMAKAGRYPLLDLTDALRHGSGGLRGRAYYLNDVHWNLLGHTIAAREVERLLAREGWLPG